MLVHTDADAVLLVDLALDRGLRVPQDLAIVAYDDEIASLARIPLTAIAPPKLDLGETAVRMALARLRRDREDRSGLARATLLTTLVDRASSHT
ncbi:substrate-binding domain-containing protein [Microbacterium sp. bgisy189]|uniref:substrate-binding domain-containing protein n=1 Tax=Microbacterium sp. bgisy189 TaxID=3413798 RepID=UPI003EBDA8A7